MAINKVIYGADTLIDLTGDTVTADKMLSGTKAHDKSGAAITGSIASQAAQTIMPGTADKTIAAGKHLSGAQIIKGDANLLAENIKSGVSIFDVLGTFEGEGGGGGLPQGISALVTGTFTQASSATSNGKTITHNLGVMPTFALLVDCDDLSSGDAGALLFSLAIAKQFAENVTGFTIAGGYGGDGYGITLGYDDAISNITTYLNASTVKFETSRSYYNLIGGHTYRWIVAQLSDVL